MNNLSHRYHVYVIFSSILAGLLITTLISSTVLISSSNAGITNTNNANTNTNETNPITSTDTNSTNILYHIDQAQKAIQIGNITGALRHLDLAKQSLESNPLHSIQRVPPLKGPPVPPKGPIKEPTEPASNLSRGDK